MTFTKVRSKRWYRYALYRHESELLKYVLCVTFFFTASRFTAFMMFGGYETIEAYENELYREESSSELSVDSEVEFQLYSQVHYAQDLDNVMREEEHEERNSGNSESFSSKPNQKNLIVLSDSEVIQLSDGSEVITLSDEDSIYRCERKNFRVHAKDKTQGSPASLHSNDLADKKCKRDIEKSNPGERSGTIRRS